MKFYEKFEEYSAKQEKIYKNILIIFFLMLQEFFGNFW